MPPRLSLLLRAVRGALLAWFLLFPSLGVVQKYFGSRMALVYAGVGTLALVVVGLASRWLWTRLTFINRRYGLLMVGAIMAGLLLGFAVLYPRATSGEASWLSPSGIAGGGSDRDDALNLGVRAVLAGRYPYYERTQLDNPISQLPGSLLLAAPFVWLGNAAWQNLPWMGVWLLVLGYLFEDWRAAAAISLLVLVSSPIVLQDFVTGGDLAINSIIVLLACLALERTQPTDQPTNGAVTSGGARMAALVFAGVVFATRLNFLLLMPLVFVRISHAVGARTALRDVTAITVIILALTVPFYLYDPAAFSPLAAQDKFRMVASVLPHGELMLPAICGFFACVAAFTVRQKSERDWLLAAGIVLTAPATLLVVASAALHATTLQPAVYGLPGLFFGVLGVSLPRRDRDKSYTAVSA